MVEALVIGAGPAGSSAALALARAGHEVLLVDRCRFPRPKPCGEYYNPECVRLLAELGLSTPALLSAGARTIPVLHLGTPDSGTLSVPFAEVGPAGDPALTLGREVLDTLLVEEARRAGVTVWEGVLAREPLVEVGGVCGARLRVDGIDRDVRARVTLAADGLRSRFARCLGLAGGIPRRRKLGITARNGLRDGVPERLEMHALQGGCCGLALRGSEANLGMVVDLSRAREVGGDPAGFVKSELERHAELSAWLDGPPQNVLTVGPLAWKTRRQWLPGCLLLGDAAGFYDPFTGQGVTFALLTARLAAAAGVEFLREGQTGALARYGRERQGMLGPRIGVQMAIQEVLNRPWLARRVIGRLNRRPEVARTLIGVIADVTPAGRVLQPAFVAGLLA